MAKSAEEAKKIIESEIKAVREGSLPVKDGCVACHMIFSIAKKLGSNESDAADLLSHTLTDQPSLNDEFIDTVEYVHMRSRQKALAFYARSREAKDRYVESYFKNALTELQTDASIHGGGLALRKIVLNYLSSYLAQTLGVDFHASTEELYYVLRKHEDFEGYLESFLARFSKEIKQSDQQS